MKNHRCDTAPSPIAARRPVSARQRDGSEEYSHEDVRNESETELSMLERSEATVSAAGE